LSTPGRRGSTTKRRGKGDGCANEKGFLRRAKTRSQHGSMAWQRVVKEDMPALFLEGNATATARGAKGEGSPGEGGGGRERRASEGTDRAAGCKKNVCKSPGRNSFGGEKGRVGYAEKIILKEE